MTPRPVLFNSDGLKPCSVCKRMLPREAFSKTSRMKSGYSSACSKCKWEQEKRKKERVKRGDLSDGRHARRILFDENGLKKCTLCGKKLPKESYTRSSTTASGYDTRCKKCNTKRVLRARSNNIDLCMKMLMESHKTRVRASSKVNVIHKYPDDVTVDVLKEMWEKQSGRCAVSGVQMTTIYGHGYISTNVSLDRIDPQKGYTRDNIQLVTIAVNKIKHMLTNEQLFFWCQRILEGPLARQFQDGLAY